MNHPPSTKLTPEEIDLVWKFRYYLTKEKKALPKFLRAVNWDTEAWTDLGPSPEVTHALEMLAKWTRLDIEDALELLTPAFRHPDVRKYAVDILKQADDKVRLHASILFSSHSHSIYYFLCLSLKIQYSNKYLNLICT